MVIFNWVKCKLLKNAFYRCVVLSMAYFFVGLVYYVIAYTLLYLQTSLDGSVGLIFETLKNAGVDQNTFVFFTADNGYRWTHPCEM